MKTGTSNGEYRKQGFKRNLERGQTKNQNSKIRLEL